MCLCTAVCYEVLDVFREGGRVCVAEWAGGPSWPGGGAPW